MFMMGLWSRIRRILGGGSNSPAPGDPLSEIRWLAPSDNPFGVELLDCRSMALDSPAMESTITETYLGDRASDGRRLVGRIPDDAESRECLLRYPFEGTSGDGALFRSMVMEDKWDIDLYEGHLYFARSWTGQLVFRAAIAFVEGQATVTSVTAPREMFEPDPLHPIAIVDFLIRSHVHGWSVPHPLPPGAGSDPGQLALVSFSLFGRHAHFGTFADTTRLEPQPFPQ
jgi:hypothetical protein